MLLTQSQKDAQVAVKAPVEAKEVEIEWNRKLEKFVFDLTKKVPQALTHPLRDKCINSGLVFKTFYPERKKKEAHFVVSFLFKRFIAENLLRLLHQTKTGSKLFNGAEDDWICCLIVFLNQLISLISFRVTACKWYVNDRSVVFTSADVVMIVASGSTEQLEGLEELKSP